MSKVFLIEPTRQDVSAAARFGEVVCLFDGVVKRPSVWAKGYGDLVVDELVAQGFDSERDFIVTAGSTVSLVQVAAAMARRFEEFAMLLFDATGDRYVERVLGSPSPAIDKVVRT